MDVPEPGEEPGSEAVFNQLFLLADMRQEYEQSQQLRQLLARSPSVLIGMDLVSTHTHTKQILPTTLLEEEELHTSLMGMRTPFMPLWIVPPVPLIDIAGYLSSH